MNLSYAAPLTEGFLLGAGLIIGLGPQNAVVLRQGLKRQHLLAMVVVCTLLDVSLIALGR
jgi:L-lysine exporter family protein LysE/ArgO